MTNEPGNKLLWLAAGAFAVMIAAWAVFLVMASKNKIEEVPLPPRESR